MFLQQIGGRVGPKSGLSCPPSWGLDTQPLSQKGHLFIVVVLPPSIHQHSLTAYCVQAGAGVYSWRSHSSPI